MADRICARNNMPKPVMKDAVDVSEEEFVLPCWTMLIEFCEEGSMMQADL